MILFFISIVLLILTFCGVNIPYWIVSLPAIIIASFSLWLFMKSEFEYLKSIRKNNKDIEE